MGLGFYGRTYQLTDPSCWQPGCAFTAAGAAGKCTNTAGMLSYSGKINCILQQIVCSPWKRPEILKKIVVTEIMKIIRDTDATPHVDTTAAVNYMVYSGNNWVSYVIFLT
jgi:chitinase